MKKHNFNVVDGRRPAQQYGNWQGNNSSSQFKTKSFLYIDLYKLNKAIYEKKKKQGKEWDKTNRAPIEQPYKPCFKKGGKVKLIKKSLPKRNHKMSCKDYLYSLQDN